MAFDVYCGAVARGAIVWWRPDYLAGPTPEAVAHWFPPRAAEVREACIADFCRQQREPLARLNRALRDSTVRLFGLGRRIILVDTYDGEWRSADGANRGYCLIELGAWRWACRFGQAGYRIARLCGLRSVPRTEGAA
jgi:hypothetical protein